jgi:hypothetical protein
MLLHATPPKDMGWRTVSMHKRNNNQMRKNSYDKGVGGADVRKPNEYLRDLEISATDEAKNQI